MQSYKLSLYKLTKDAEKSASLILNFRTALICHIIIHSYSHIHSRLFIIIRRIDAFLDDDVIILNLYRCSDNKITVGCETILL